MTKLIVWGENLAYRLGGAEKTTYLVVQALSALAGVEVTVVSGVRAGGGPEPRRYDYPNLVGIPLTKFRYGLTFLQFALNARPVGEYFRRSAADLLFANAQSAPMAIESFPGPSVYFVHDEVSLNVHRTYEHRLAKRLTFAARLALDAPFLAGYRLRNRNAMRRARLVVANSSYVAAKTKKRFGVDAAVVYPQVDVQGLSRVQLPSIAERPFIMMVGDQEVKGVRTFREVARAMPDERFLAVGRSYTDRVDGNLTFRGFADDAIEHYRSAKLVLVPSVWEEGFGMVSVEAAGLGIPTIVSDRGGLPETVPSRELVVAGNRDVGRWVERIRAVLASYDDFSGQARRHAAAFDRKRQIAELVRAVHKATGIDLGRGS